MVLMLQYYLDTISLLQSKILPVSTINVTNIYLKHKVAIGH